MENRLEIKRFYLFSSCSKTLHSSAEYCPLFQATLNPLTAPRQTASSSCDLVHRRVHGLPISEPHSALLECFLFPSYPKWMGTAPLSLPTQYSSPRQPWSTNISPSETDVSMLIFKISPGEDKRPSDTVYHVRSLLFFWPHPFLLREEILMLWRLFLLRQLPLCKSFPLDIPFWMRRCPPPVDLLNSAVAFQAICLIFSVLNLNRLLLCLELKGLFLAPIRVGREPMSSLSLLDLFRYQRSAWNSLPEKNPTCSGMIESKVE